VTSDNDALIRAIYARWAEGDFSDATWAHPDFELVLVDGPAPGRFTGLTEAGAAWGATIDGFAEFRTIVEDIRAIDDERVLVLTQNTGRGRASGLELGEMVTRGANVLHIRDGKVAKLDAYFDRDLALARLGLL
jgi:ketosteroid isomerase-like protein